MEKCNLFTRNVKFLGYVFLMSKDEIFIDQSKVNVVKSSTPTNVTEVMCFHGLASFYILLTKNFSTLSTPITKCLKKGTFEWSKVAQSAFETLKTKAFETPILALLIF